MTRSLMHLCILHVTTRPGLATLEMELGLVRVGWVASVYVSVQHHAEGFLDISLDLQLAGPSFLDRLSLKVPVSMVDP